MKTLNILVLAFFMILMLQLNKINAQWANATINNDPVNITGQNDVAVGIGDFATPLIPAGASVPLVPIINEHLVQE